MTEAIFNHHPFGLPNDLYPHNRNDFGVIAYDTAYDPGLRPRKAVSRKVHGTAGSFDLEGIEGRSGGPNQDYQLVITFHKSVTFESAAVTSGTGRVVSSSSNGSELTVNLTGVASAQTIIVTLSKVSNGVQTKDVAVPLTVLVGDVTASTTVTTTASGRGATSDLDLLREIREIVGGAVTSASFRFDVTSDGVIDDSDLSLVQANSGKVLR